MTPKGILYNNIAGGGTSVGSATCELRTAFQNVQSIITASAIMQSRTKVAATIATKIRPTAAYEVQPRLCQRKACYLRRNAQVPTAGNGSFSYSCSSWTSVASSHGDSDFEHKFSAHGDSLDGHHLKETVRIGNNGQTRVLREVTSLELLISNSCTCV